MDILKRSLAPIPDEAWTLIRAEAASSFKTGLSARKIVDMSDPKGVTFGAVALGRIQVPDDQTADGVRWGIHQVLPLVEVRAAFQMRIWDLDNAARGARDIDFKAVTTAARRVAGFEETAIYQGFAPAGIMGLAQNPEHRPIPLPAGAADYPEVVARAVVTLRDAEVSGPYALVLGPDPYRQLESDHSGYPAAQRILALIEGPILLAPFIDGGFLVSLRGGDFELVVGLEPSVGYETHDTVHVRLFVTESFTFRIFHPEAAIELPAAGD